MESAKSPGLQNFPISWFATVMGLAGSTVAWHRAEMLFGASLMLSPAWFIPVVGNILVPIAGVGHASAEISWFFISIGLLFWLVLLTTIFYRMFFHQPLPARLLPTLFIRIAPPAAGFISWVELTGSVDAFARILYYTATFLTLMLLTQTRHFLRLQFSLSWWAYSFPMAAITIATFVMFQELQLPFFPMAGWCASDAVDADYCGACG